MPGKHETDGRQRAHRGYFIVPQKRKGASEQQNITLHVPVLFIRCNQSGLWWEVWRISTLVESPWNMRQTSHYPGLPPICTFRCDSQQDSPFSSVWRTQQAAAANAAAYMADAAARGTKRAAPPSTSALLALGEPLPSRRAKDGKPTDAEIDELHLAYQEAMVAVFERYKAAAGYPDAELSVL